ncbi:MAG: hypothetical protein WA115_05445 [Polynucleobacter sp.]
MKNLLKLSAVVLLISLAGCLPPPKSTKTALELQSFQAKEFETSKKIAFASTLSVLQDHGYIIGSANLDTGLISGKSPTNSSNKFFYREMSDVKATAFVEEITPGRTKVRLNFVNSTSRSGGYGQRDDQDYPIEDPAIYQEIFSKIQQGIFVRKNAN